MTRTSLLQLVRFVLVGVANTVTYYVVYLPLQAVTPYLFAHLVAFCASVVRSVAETVDLSPRGATGSRRRAWNTGSVTPWASPTDGAALP